MPITKQRKTRSISITVNDATLERLAFIEKHKGLSSRSAAIAIAVNNEYMAMLEEGAKKLK